MPRVPRSGWRDRLRRSGRRPSRSRCPPRAGCATAADRRRPGAHRPPRGSPRRPNRRRHRPPPRRAAGAPRWSAARGVRGHRRRRDRLLARVQSRRGQRRPSRVLRRSAMALGRVRGRGIGHIRAVDNACHDHGKDGADQRPGDVDPDVAGVARDQRGASERTGFIDAPSIGNAMSPHSAMVSPTANAASGPTIRYRSAVPRMTVTRRVVRIVSRTRRCHRRRVASSLRRERRHRTASGQRARRRSPRPPGSPSREGATRRETGASTRTRG